MALGSKAMALEQISVNKVAEFWVAIAPSTILLAEVYTQNIFFPLVFYR